MSIVDKLRRKRFLMKDGHLLVVLRPKDPGFALRLARDLVGKEADEEFQHILRTQPYRFVGYAARKAGQILDSDGKVIDTLQLGDSFASGEAFAAPRAFGNDKVFDIDTLKVGDRFASREAIPPNARVREGS